MADLTDAVHYNGAATDEELRKLRDEIEALKSRVYNLTLYLADAAETPLIGTMVMRRVIRRHPDLPGYIHTILEEAAEP